jgi:hypothetical protein
MQTFQQDQLMDCPECGRRALVRHNANVYQCLSCQFRRDLSDSWGGDVNRNSGFFWFMLLAITIAILLGSQAPQAPTRTSPSTEQSVVDAP